MSGTKLASGKLKANKDGDGEITKDTVGDEFTAENGDLEQRKINTSDKQSKYYYLVVKYPNSNTPQSETDMAKQIKVTLSIDGKPASTVYQAA